MEEAGAMAVVAVVERGAAVAAQTPASLSSRKSLLFPRMPAIATPWFVDFSPLACKRTLCGNMHGAESREQLTPKPYNELHPNRQLPHTFVRLQEVLCPCSEPRHVPSPDTGRAIHKSEHHLQCDG